MCCGWLSALFLLSIPRDSNANGSTLVLGARVPSYGVGPVVTIPLIEEAYWMIGLLEFDLGGLDLCSYTPERCAAIVDSGTSFIGMAAVQFQQVAALGSGSLPQTHTHTNHRLDWIF